MWFMFALAGIGLALFAGTLAMIELGRRSYFWGRGADRAPAAAGLGSVEGAIFTLLGLLLAFTFSGAAGRFDERKHLVGQETNALGTAWLRIELLPVDERPPLQNLFRSYVDARIDSYRFGIEDPRTEQARKRAMELQSAMWSAFVAACPNARTASGCALLLAALNDVIDITTTRDVATWIHPPLPVYAMLFALALAAGLLTGYSMAPNRERNWLHRLLFAAGITAAIVVTLDLEFPRLGMIRVDAVDQLIVDLRASFDR